MNEATGYSGSFHFYGEYDRGDPRKLYALFRRPPESKKGHLAMRALRDADDELYAKLYRENGVELWLLPNGPGTQKAAVNSDGLIVSYDHRPSGNLLVFGLAADHVEAVEIDVDGRVVPARLENNTYAVVVAAELRDSGIAPFRLVLHRADGSTFRI